MADLPRSQVTVHEHWREGNNTQFTVKDISLTLTGHGSNTNKITAEALGFTFIRDVRAAVNSNGTHVNAAPSFDRTYLTLAEKGFGVPTDFLDELVRLIVVGKS